MLVVGCGGRDHPERGDGPCRSRRRGQDTPSAYLETILDRHGTPPLLGTASPGPEPPLGGSWGSLPHPVSCVYGSNVADFRVRSVVC
jgi:hypothetical protein